MQRGEYWRFLLLLWVFIAGGPTTSGTILLHNDSTVILTAIIQASDGTYLGQFSVQPGQQRNFTTNMAPTTYNRPGAPDISLTPYTVIWQCPSEGIYSTHVGVQPGSYVRASWGEGNHFCAPKKEEKKGAPASELKKRSP